VAAKSSENKEKNEVKRLLDELVNVKFMKQDLAPPYRIQFEGSFELQSFASHGIILMGEKIFNVCFSLSQMLSILFKIHCNCFC
jgi:hypothetical protein